MRVSVNPNDPGFIKYRQDFFYRVFCNRKEIDHCHTADEDLGVAIAHDMEPKDSLGRPVEFKHFAGMPQKIFRGDVVLIRAWRFGI